MHRITKILIFVSIVFGILAAYWLLNLNNRVPQEALHREFKNNCFAEDEIDLINKFSQGLLSNEKDGTTALVVDNKFQFLCIFDRLLQQGVYFSFIDKRDSAAIKFSAAFQIAEIFSKATEDDFFKKQYQFITSLKGNRIYQKSAIDLFYNSGKKYSGGGDDSTNLAKDYFKKSLRLCRKINDQKREVDNLLQLQFILYHSGSHNQALELGYEVLKLARKIGYRYRESWALYSISTTQINMNQYYQALNNATKGLVIAKELNDHRAIMSNLERITVANRRLGNFTKALEANDESLQYSKALNNISDQIKNYINYGTIYCNQGDYAKSKDYFEFALNLAHQRHDYNESTSLENLGELYRILGDYEQALSYNSKALDLNVSTGNGYRIAGTKKYIGDIYKDQKDYTEALQYYEEAIRLLKTENEKALPLRLAADIWLCIGDVEQLSGNRDKALDSYFLALEAFEKVRNPEGIINSMTRIGNLYRELKEFQQAFRYLREAIKIGKDHQDPMLLCDAYYGLGLVNRDQGILESATDSFLKAIQEIETVRDKIYYEQEKINYFANVQKLYEEMIITQLDKANDDSAFNYSERCRARALYDLYSGSPEIFTPVSSQPTSNDGTRNTNFNHMLPPGISEIQANLDENIQLIEYKLTANKVLIFVVNKNNLYIRESHISREALDSLIYNFRETIGAESDREFRKRALQSSKSVYDQSIVLAEKLYNYLISPVERLLDNDKVLYIIPDELLYYLPFAALVSQESGAPRYLIEDFVIAYTPSAAIMINNFEKRKPDIPFEKLSVLAIGNPGGDLIGSEEEVCNIADLFLMSKLLLRNEATKAKFLAIAKNSYHAIHLATHAVINEKSPLYSYFVFGGDVGDNHSGVASTRNSLNTSREDNMLMAHEIFKINLSETRLVFLSACQTGCGKIFRGEGVIGISRAFMKGGASSIISTLWKIDDQYSMKITETFYHEWKNNNLTKANALRTAQLSLLNEIKNDRKIVYPHPFIWAGFTLLGDYK